MITPQLNLNGSSADDLIEPRLKADRLLADVLEALSQAVPHGRDYPGNAVACIADREEHYDRIKAIRALQDILIQEALAIKEQIA